MPDAAWESYFYPHTYDPTTGQGTLKNHFGELDPHRLRALEYAETRIRYLELTNGTAQIPRTYDAAHLQAIHQHLFGNVYPWAGEMRIVNLFKGNQGFADLAAGEVDRYLADVHHKVTATDWTWLDQHRFAEQAGDVFAHLNQAHPFREGNGRTSKIFLTHVSELSQFTLDYTLIDSRNWNDASEWSRPNQGTYPPHPQTMVSVFHAIAAPRTSPPHHSQQTHPAAQHTLGQALNPPTTRRGRPGGGTPANPSANPFANPSAQPSTNPSISRSINPARPSHGPGSPPPAPRYRP